LLPLGVAPHWDKYVSGKEAAGQTAQTSQWRVARTVFVADDDAVARSYGRDDPDSPYRFYYQQMLTKMAKLGRLGLFKKYREEPDEAITLERVLDDLVITGTASSVAEQILAFREQTGEFGELVYAGLDWIDADLAKRSMELMAEKVMPEVNAALS
jgi:alkanesulfonate monooxygenase SsuD/methylene tetrahydromethanopterin reductase-like flavin-dependent oxidoreductase (luciferase family)